MQQRRPRRQAAWISGETDAIRRAMDAGDGGDADDGLGSADDSDEDADWRPDDAGAPPDESDDEDEEEPPRPPSACRGKLSVVGISTRAVVPRPRSVKRRRTAASAAARWTPATVDQAGWIAPPAAVSTDSLDDRWDPAVDEECEEEEEEEEEETPASLDWDSFRFSSSSSSSPEETPRNSEGIAELIQRAGTFSTRALSQVEQWQQQVGMQPRALHGTLRPFQLEGVGWMRALLQAGGNGILADEMGLGKTVQAIALLAALQETGSDAGPHLVLCPTTTVDNWRRELAQWCPSLRVVAYGGPLKRRVAIRQRLMSDSEPFDVLIASYSIVSQRRDRLFLKQFSFGVLILDEAQAIKNASSVRHRRAASMRSRRRLLLTGTPLENSLSELLALLVFLMPDLFSGDGDVAEWLSRADASARENGDAAQFLATDAARVRRLIAPFCLRRLKSEVATELAPKTRVTVACHLAPAQQRVYHAIAAATSRRGLFASPFDGDSDPDDDDKEHADTGLAGLQNALMQLRKAACSSVFFRTRYTRRDVERIAAALARPPPSQEEEEKEEEQQQPPAGTIMAYFRALSPPTPEPDSAPAVGADVDALLRMSDLELHRVCLRSGDARVRGMALSDAQLFDESSGKLSELRPLLGRCRAAGSKVLIFSQMTRVLDLLELFLAAEHHPHLRIDGSTPVDDRMGLIRAFESDSRPLAFLLSTRAAGLGITLATANTVVLFDVSFNPQADRQAEDRAHRIGQTQTVTVYRLVTSGTVETAVLARADAKAAVADAALGETPAQSKSKKQEEQEQEQEQAASLRVELAALVAAALESDASSRFTRAK